MRIALASFVKPPTADGGYGKGGSFVRDANEQRAAIGLGVEDAIQNGHALGLRAKVVVVDRGGSAIPLGASILEVPPQFPLLAFDPHHPISLSPLTPPHFPALL